MSTLLVTPRADMPPKGGRAQLSHLLETTLRNLRAEHLAVHRLVARSTRWTNKLAGVWKGYLDGIDAASTARILTLLDELDVDELILDGSNLGAIAAAARKRRPSLRIVTFLHNVEARFFRDALRHARTLHAFGVLLANRKAEAAAVRNSDVLVCLTNRDRVELGHLYGREGTCIVPMALPEAPVATAAIRPGQFMLFVGGTFYANLAGISWYAHLVAPRLPLPTIVIGHGFEALRSKLELPGCLEVVGSVDDLTPWYAGAVAVVAPIFDGSGMKTKVAEALQHGKHVLGTPDAFAGYEDLPASVHRVCTDADAFVEAITLLQSNQPPAFDSTARHHYETHHSPTAFQAAWQRLLEEAKR